MCPLLTIAASLSLDHWNRHNGHQINQKATKEFITGQWEPDSHVRERGSEKLEDVSSNYLQPVLRERQAVDDTCGVRRGDSRDAPFGSWCGWVKGSSDLCSAMGRGTRTGNYPLLSLPTGLTPVFDAKDNVDSLLRASFAQFVA